VIVVFSVIISVVLVVIFVVPMAFMQLPALALVVIVRMVPIGTFVRRSVPTPRHPSVVMPVGSPIALDPGIAGARFRSPFFIA
jgi:hypothetical protein